MRPEKDDNFFFFVFFFFLSVILSDGFTWPCACLCNLDNLLEWKENEICRWDKRQQKSIPSVKLCVFFFNIHIICNDFIFKRKKKSFHFPDTHDINGFPIITIETKILMDSGLNCYEVATLILYYNTIPTK